MRFDSSGWGTEVFSGTCSPAEFVRSEGSLHSRFGLQSSSVPIDTLKAAWHLQEGDAFSLEQAERIAETLSEMDVASATKEDLNGLEERPSSLSPDPLTSAARGAGRGTSGGP